LLRTETVPSAATRSVSQAKHSETAELRSRPAEKQLSTAARCTAAAVKTAATGRQETATDCVSADLAATCSLASDCAHFHAAFQARRQTYKIHKMND